MLNTPLGVIINRADLGDKRVFDYCKKENIPILMTIPFDKKVAESYAKGELLIEDKLWNEQFLELWEKIKSVISK